MPNHNFPDGTPVAELKAQPDLTAASPEPANPANPFPLVATKLQAGYTKETEVLHGVSTKIPRGKFTVILGPNACGKSTLLRTLARLLNPTAGTVLLEGQGIAKLKTKELARQLGLLPQSPLVPEAISVRELVGRGRYPYQSVLSQFSKADQAAVENALAVTGVSDLADRSVDTLSGGQRQRVWIALALAQETPVLLLDEPTTYLDITHQVEVLELVRSLIADGKTVVAVLHELNHAARYADYLIAMRDGKILAEGSPQEIITAESIAKIYGLKARILLDEVTGSPVVLPD